MECHWWVLIPLLKGFESKINYPYIYIYTIYRYIFGVRNPTQDAGSWQPTGFVVFSFGGLSYETNSLAARAPKTPPKSNHGSWTQTKRFDQKSMDQLILILGQQEKAEGIFWGTHCHWVSWTVWYVPSHSPYFQVQDFYRLITHDYILKRRPRNTRLTMQ